MIIYQLTPLNLILGENMGKIVMYTEDNKNFKIDVIYAEITKGNKKHKKEFVVENVDDEDLFYVYQQIACEMFITKEIKH